MVGQPEVVAYLTRYVANPASQAMLFEGDTGTGKTTAALALAADLGCDVAQREFGGVYSIASGEQTAEAVRAMTFKMSTAPLLGSGWTTVIVNEADRMARPAETIWLDLLEDLPRRTAVIFTTNDPQRLSQRFLDRCIRLPFESQAEAIRGDTEDLLADIWRREGGVAPDTDWIAGVVESSVVDGRLSFRRAIQTFQARLATYR
jgi:DNA polymerase III delta prime subunit